MRSATVIAGKVARRSHRYRDVQMKFGRETVGSIVQVLSSIERDFVDVLFHKHLGGGSSEFGVGLTGFLNALEYADEDVLAALVAELVRETSAIRAYAPTKYVFDGAWREFERWLLHDGWAIENGELVRLSPEAEEITGVRDSLIEELQASGLDSDGAIRKCLEDAASAFVADPPDFNDSTTKVRIALETMARRAASKLAQSGKGSYPNDSWGKALEFLRDVGVLDPGEEQIIARVYTFVSPGAHVPAGVTEEEWARLARTFVLASCYFLLKKYLAAV